MEVPYASPKAQSPNVNRVGGPMQNPSQNEVRLNLLTFSHLYTFSKESNFLFKVDFIDWERKSFFYSNISRPK